MQKGCEVMRRVRNILCLVIVCVLLIVGCSGKKNIGVKISKNNAVDTVIKNERKLCPLLV